MRTFKDANGKDWALTVNVTTRKKVQADVGFDLFGLVDGAELEKLNDPELLVGVLFSLCSAQADTNSISPEQFAAALVGDVIDDAFEALMAATADFFPKSRRAVMTAAIKKGADLTEQATALALKKIAAVTVESLLPPESKNESTSLPESSESASMEPT